MWITEAVLIAALTVSPAVVMAQTEATPDTTPAAPSDIAGPPGAAARSRPIPNPRVQSGETEIERRARERDAAMSRRICRGC
jgi:hypothetical protein